MYEIEFYDLEDGRTPVQEFLDCHIQDHSAMVFLS